MSNAIPTVPVPANEPILSYAPGTPERDELKAALADRRDNPLDVPLLIGGKPVRTDKRIAIVEPHDHSRSLGSSSSGDASHVSAAVDAG